MWESLALQWRSEDAVSYKVENCHTKNPCFLYLGLDFVWLLYYNGHCE